MKTLQYLNTLIDTNLASESFITASEHREVEKAIVSSTVPANRGFITNYNLGDLGARTVGGDITAATSSAKSVLCTMANTMPSMNYLVKIHVESLGTDSQDTQTACPMFKKVSTTQFNFVIAETGNSTQNLKVHFEIISLD